MAAEKSWTFEEKLALSEVVENLPVNEHPQIYRIILAMDPDTLEDCEDDPAWTYIHFHLLRPETLKELEGYIASRSVNTQSEIKENNPVEYEKEESSSKSTSNKEKLPCSEGATGSAEKTGEVSIKARLRRTCRKSEASHSKLD